MRQIGKKSYRTTKLSLHYSLYKEVNNELRLILKIARQDFVKELMEQPSKKRTNINSSASLRSNDISSVLLKQCAQPLSHIMADDRIILKFHPS